MIHHYREYNWCTIEKSTIESELQEELMLFQGQHAKYLQETQQFTLQFYQTFQQLISQHYPNYFVKIYGSYAQGTNMPWSDLDLFLERTRDGPIPPESIPFEVESMLKVRLPDERRDCERC